MRLLGSFIVLCVAGVIGFYLYIQNYENQRVLLEQDKIFIVEQGESLHSVGHKLEAEGIIPNAQIFVKIGQLKGYQKIRFGEYKVASSDNIGNIYRRLTSGEVIKYEIVFTEGSHRFDLASQLEKYNLVNKEKFLKMTMDAQLIQSLLGEKLPSLEGYLFPDTYYFSRADGEKKIIKKMVGRFFEVFNTLNTEGSSLSRHQLVTLASIIEKETGAGFERPKISSVFHNRILKKMRLQTDPTVIYGNLLTTGIETKNITRKHLKTMTPYNTYLIAGLPPGPIGNPGIESLKASFLPEDTKFLYFVSQNDGTHVFTTNYQDHLAAVKKFQMNPKMRQGKSWRDLKKKKK